jgi:transketolase
VPSMREQACATVTELLDEDDRVAVILGEISISYFRDALHRYPSRVINVGIMEQTMVGVAAGFAMEGFHPVVHTITPFLVERPLEQVKLDFGYQRLGGTFIGVGASYDYSAEGPTHHSPGDVAVLSTIPGFEILIPGTAAEADRLIRSTYTNGLPTYIRAAVRQNPESFDVLPGVMEIIRRGRQATLIAVGPMLGPVLEATKGLDVSILYATSVLPFDAQTLRREAGEFVVAVEPFLEGTVAPRIMEALDRPVRVMCIGVPRRTLERYGTPEDLDVEAGLEPSQIRNRLEPLIGA